MAAVEKLAGKMSAHVTKIPTESFPNTALKSFILFWFTESTLATNMTSAIFAKSEGCIVSPVPGISSQRVASLILEPAMSVRTSSGMARYKAKMDTLLYTR